VDYVARSEEYVLSLDGSQHTYELSGLGYPLRM
jgi:hypothetical protein